MAEVNLKYNTIDTIIQCAIEDKLKDVCEKFGIKNNKDINKLIFIYGGELLNLELSFNEVANQIDKQTLKMNILVYDRNPIIIEEKESIKKSKDIMCPKCGASCILDCKDYKIELNNCRNKHKEVIKIKEFDNTQNIDENEIICNVCNINNKGSSYDNKFYICGTCNKNICLLCKENHNKEHILIDYEKRNYLCHKHDEIFASYCEICKENLCMQCQIEHNNNHKIISYMKMLKNINNITIKIKELKDIIDRFNDNIDNIMNILKNIKINIEKYYMIYNNILNNYDVKKRNYELYKNLNSINYINNNIIIKDVTDIINEKNIINKFNRLYELNMKIENNEIKKNEVKKNEVKKNEVQKNEAKKKEVKKNEIKKNEVKKNEVKKNEVKKNESNKTKIKKILNEINQIKNNEKIKDKVEYKNKINLIYKTKEKGTFYIFGYDFVCNNKNNIELIINGNKSELIDYYNLEKGNNNIQLIIKNDLTNLYGMFYEIHSIYNIDELKYLNVSKCTSFRSMFYHCSSLSDIKPLEKWDVSKCTDFSYMFSRCYSLLDISPLKKWNVSNCTNFTYLFYDCFSLSDIKPLEKWDVSNCTDFSYMFYGCSSLSDIKPLEKWDVSKCSKFISMFYGCSLLSDIKPLEKWDVSKCTIFDYMFYGCSEKLDINQLKNWRNINENFKKYNY